ncbi:hypothetical protein NHX12_024839 [Muraenolepis orangiensis]|uniref:Anaphase-promoting complex subunit 4 WD40 domain-containing protein n=1 Tax=Muraenolepis orangiensis TaxID=630683 RepID=A0A9Q0ELR4_9TELE|nr:hypothetical protein NHX12_024839 [Muraenolepis orangiensis]
MSQEKQPHLDGDLHLRSELKCGRDVMRCQFNKDGSLLAVGLSDGAVKVYSPDSGDQVLTLRDSSSSRMPVTGLRFISSSESRCLLLAAYAKGSVRCWYPWGGDCLWALRESDDPTDGEKASPSETLCLAVSPDGERAATGESNATIHLYDLHTHQSILNCQASSCRTVMDGHRSRVFAVTFHPERETEFISAGWDNTIQALHIDAAKNHILSGSWRSRDSLEVWDYGSGRKVCDVSDLQHASKIYTCHWLGESHMVVGGSEDNMLAVISRNSLQTEGRLAGLGSPVCSSSVCVGGKQSGLIAGASGSSVYLLDHHK